MSTQTPPRQATNTSASARDDRQPPRIEILSEEYHEFPANRPGSTTRAPNSNVKIKDTRNGAAAGTDSGRSASDDRKGRGSAQERLEASRAKQRQQNVIDNLPPGHPMRDRLEQQQKQNMKNNTPTSSSSNSKFSTKRRPTRLDLERQRKGITEDVIQPPSQAEIDPNYQSIGLPSEFRLYDFKQLTVSNLKGVHQAKLSRAAKERKMRYVVEAISSTLGEGVSAFDLTPQDFYFLMYWHRLQSFPKNPQMIPFTCTAKDHIRRTILRTDHPEYLSPDTLDISTILTDTSLKTEYLQTLDLSKWADLDAKYQLGVETMRDIVEFSELQEEEAYYKEESNENPSYEEENDSGEEDLGSEGTTASLKEETSDEDFTEVEWLQERSVFLKRGPGRNTILERNEIIKDFSSDEIFELEKYIEAVSAYGVAESTTLKCKACGASHRVKLSVDALTFLP